ncbi:HlyD family secretion protein [Nitrosomonas sp.]|uniref:HlyD family secretion protein n=1 Tax=Nitrosomonas sp. TaxID=42353 RepID=UPI00374D1548
MKIRFNQPEQRIPNDDRGIRIQYGEARRPIRPWRWYLILIVSSLPLLYLIGLVLQEMLIVKAGGRITVPHIIVRASIDGYVKQVFVKSLHTVAGGEELAILENLPLEDSFQRLITEINFLNEEKNKRQRQSGNTTSQSMSLLKFAQEQEKFYQNRLHQYESLFKQGAATQAEVASARNQYHGALENLVLNERSQRRDQGFPTDTLQMASRISQLSLELEQIKDQKKQLFIKSPADGLITELFVQPGEYLGKGQPFLDIIFPEKAHISAFIPPKYQDYVVVDQIVTVTLPNGETAKARISSIPGVTQKSPVDGINLLEYPRSAILVHMEFINPVKTQLINGTPVDIRFPFFSDRADRSR